MISRNLVRASTWIFPFAYGGPSCKGDEGFLGSILDDVDKNFASSHSFCRTDSLLAPIGRAVFPDWSIFEFHGISFINNNKLKTTTSKKDHHYFATFIRKKICLSPLYPAWGTSNLTPFRLSKLERIILGRTRTISCSREI